METRHNFLVFIRVSHNTKETFDNPNLVGQFENSTNPLRKPMLPCPKKREKVLSSKFGLEGILLKRFHLET
jgi:hypothetical protein